MSEWNFREEIRKLEKYQCYAFPKLEKIFDEYIRRLKDGWIEMEERYSKNRNLPYIMIKFMREFEEFFDKLAGPKLVDSMWKAGFDDGYKQANEERGSSK